MCSNETILWDTSTWKIVDRYIRDSGGATGFGYLADGKHVFALMRGGDAVLYLENSLNGEIIESVQLPYNNYSKTLEQNPVNRNRFALGFDDEVWLYEIVDLPQ